MIGMEKRIVLIALVATLCICTLSFALSQPLLVVKDSLTKAGNTYLALVLPGKSEEVRLTEDMFRISFPRVCERTGMIGFTHHTASMKAEIYLIPPGQTKPEKVKDGAILEGFSPDGKYLLYTNASAAPSLWAFDIDTGQETRLTSGLAVSSAAWSPDGQWIAFAVLTSTGRNDLYLMKWSDRSIERLTQTAQIDEYYPVFTSDSGYLAYMSNRTGEWILEYFNLETRVQYQTKIRGMYPLLSEDDSETVVEENGHIILWKTSGKESSTLTKGQTAAWITQKTASRFLGSPETTETGKVLAQATIGPQGGSVSAPGAVKLTIPSGVLDRQTPVTIREVASFQPGMRTFDFDFPGAPGVFSDWVTLVYDLPPNTDPERVCAVEEICEGIWCVVPSDYDAKTHTLRTTTAHFSKKGVISEISASDMRKIFSGAVGALGTAGTIIVITGSTAITLPVLGAVAAGAAIFGAAEVANPLVDKAYELAYGLNRTVVFGDNFNVSWTGDEHSQSYLQTEYLLVSIERASKKMRFWLDDPKITAQERADAFRALFPFSAVELYQIPKTVISLAAEIQEIKDYYAYNGYACPPSMDIWVHKSDVCGYWDGVKLHVDSDYLQNDNPDTKASRRVVIAHEFWHSVYQHNHYKSNFPWLDECLATTFESEALSDAELLYSQQDPSALPMSERFYDMYPADKLALTLRTGFVLDGTEGVDADRAKRGYHLWAWGKFLLHTQGHDTIRELLRNTIDPKLLTAEFSMFCRSLLIKELELEEDGLASIPKTPLLEYITKTGWPFLTVDKLLDTGIISLGNAGAAFTSGVALKPSPLSMTIRNIKGKAPDGEYPLILRRFKPDANEDIIALHPTKKDTESERRSLDDVEVGTGWVVIPPEWTIGLSKKDVEIPVAIVHRAVKQTWAEYFGYGDNPLYCYYLSPPIDLQIVPSGGQFTLRWSEPDFGPGLSAEHCLKGYRLFARKGNQTPVPIGMEIKPKQTSLTLNTASYQNYDKIGLACEDLYAADSQKKGLLSPIAWVDLKTGKGVWILESESYSYQLGRNLFDAETGSGREGAYEDGCFAYRISIGDGQARTSVQITAKDTFCSYWSRKGEISKFLHTWTPLPKQLVPGQKLTIQLGVSDDGCTGKYSPIFNAKTSFRAAGYDVYEVEAGGSFGSGIGTIPWVGRLQKQYEWVVPEPSALEISQPKANPMTISIYFENDAAGAVTGGVFYRYVFHPQ